MTTLECSDAHTCASLVHIFILADIPTLFSCDNVRRNKIILSIVYFVSIANNCLVTPLQVERGAPIDYQTPN